jgi:hypothetical protein
VSASYQFRGELWLYPEEAGWHFVTLPQDLAEQLREDSTHLRKGFGSIRVSASIAGHRWSTSVFPDSKTSSYLLPVKKAVRTAAGLRAGDEVDVELSLLLEH